LAQCGECDPCFRACLEDSLAFDVYRRRQVGQMIVRIIWAEAHMSKNIMFFDIKRFLCRRDRDRQLQSTIPAKMIGVSSDEFFGPLVGFESFSKIAAVLGAFAVVCGPNWRI
jgi:hypothetical protein